MRTLILALIMLFLLPTAVVHSTPPPPPDTNAKIKSVFVYNFTKYIDWPAPYKQGNFIIGVLGSASMLTELSAMAMTKKVGAQKLEVKMFPSADAVEKCHILYVSSDMAANIREISSKIKGHSTLLVTEKSGLAKQGAAINFVVQANKQKFELNKANAEKYDLSVSSTLASLAIIVD